MENMELTVAEVLEKYLEEANIRPVTKDMYKWNVKNKTFVFINNIKIKNLDQETIRAWVASADRVIFYEYIMQSITGVLN